MEEFIKFCKGIGGFVEKRDSPIEETVSCDIPGEKTIEITFTRGANGDVVSIERVTIPLLDKIVLTGKATVLVYHREINSMYIDSSKTRIFTLASRIELTRRKDDGRIIITLS